MAEEKNDKKMPFDSAQGKECCPPKKKWHRGGGGAFGFFGFVAFIGAAVYFVQQVSGFWPIVLAILKAIVWPAFLIYKVFTLLHM